MGSGCRMVDIKDWNLPYDMATIISLDKFSSLRDIFDSKIIMTSGGYDPIHPGHITSMLQAKDIYQEEAVTENRPFPLLIVVVNGDEFLTKKKGCRFIDLETRCQIVAGIRNVDYVIPFIASDPQDMTVIEAIRKIKPHVFAKGGDRKNIETIPEWDICQQLSVKILNGGGEDKKGT